MKPRDQRAELNLVVLKLKERGVKSEDLDDNVHDCKGEEAAAINNGGMEEQVAYLLSCGMKPEDMGVEDF